MVSVSKSSQALPLNLPETLELLSTHKREGNLTIALLLKKADEKLDKSKTPWQPLQLFL